MHTGAGEWIWRPLTNDGQLRVSSLLDQRLGGFGLMQRDRDFDSYLDLEARYEQRPSLWVTPREGEWGKGAVQLVEIPSNDEINDNIVAFWVPDRPFKAGEERTFSYRLQTSWSGTPGGQVASVQRTRIGWGAIPGTRRKPPRTLRQFTVDFAGEELRRLDPSQPVKPELTTSAGEIRDLTTQHLPDGGWRVAFKLASPEDRPADMRLFLKLRDRRLSETWSYVWQTSAME
jgi:glucans biosynthesis protein